MNKVEKYACGSGDGMFEDKEYGSWIHESDYDKLLKQNKQLEKSNTELITQCEIYVEQNKRLREALEELRRVVSKSYAGPKSVLGEMKQVFPVEKAFAKTFKKVDEALKP